MSFDLPPLVKSAERLLLETEKAVRLFPRYHKYQHGTVLRKQAMALTRAAHKAWRERSNQVAKLQDLSDRIDDFKLSMQLGQQIKAFNSLGQFEAIASIAVDVGKQCGGLLKEQHRKRQIAMQREASQRPQILSPRAASTYEAHP